jgi:ADP-L-glycero-D-manno-heptose 6-epimerase
MDSVIHLGACSSTMKRRDYLIQNNYKYSLELVRYCLLSRARFIYASSAVLTVTEEKGYLDDEI